MKEKIQAELARSAAVITALHESPEVVAAIESIAEHCANALRYGAKILIAGNGGSAADAQHLAGELVGRFAFDRPGLAAIALTVDSSVVTAVGNDYGYEHVFSRQVEAIGRAGDVFIGLSTSGNSANIVTAFASARRQRMTCIGLTGESGGRMVEWCDVCLKVPARETWNIQEAHMVAGHIICLLIEATLFGAA